MPSKYSNLHEQISKHLTSTASRDPENARFCISMIGHEEEPGQMTMNVLIGGSAFDLSIAIGKIIEQMLEQYPNVKALLIPHIALALMHKPEDQIDPKIGDMISKMQEDAKNGSA